MRRSTVLNLPLLLVFPVETAAWPGSAFTTLHFLCNFRIGPISYNVSSWQALPHIECNTLAYWAHSYVKTLGFVSFLKSREEWSILPTSIQYQPAKCNVTLQLTGPIRQLQRKSSVVNTVLRGKGGIGDSTNILIMILLRMTILIILNTSDYL